ncbi:MAG TPA: hypothetical protein DEG17_00965 [Cyanobacteria bacterium UBA11149]|nr:hypothetical protein [Cyanobacteria bacterium UBA11367]HBE59088.1 hypothetical protein [Cyanobacteria bacterium UBA11366]HBK64126.1 hypothetical protein [Cyanobacteria bacterium UBA11166]HBR72768.1 hypothetical protein [Cyanobacteria bacterium UBA11159]HBS67946.1 hypothetical protein [Cyanobacteria bacterium UBA11153]HBW87484.1 hypothetical protein [Cyanobacteria bacterium UBA11149]HCA94054.1 hypothetical protein [Cyanobacteria bacterium UBA9226]
MKDRWVTHNITTDHPILRKIPGGKPGSYEFKWDTGRKLLLIREKSSGREMLQIPLNSVSDVTDLMNSNTKIKDSIVAYRMPTGDQISVKISEGKEGLYITPLSGNSKNVHHHVLDKNGTIEILIRDENDQNEAAFVLNKSDGSWKQRPLTNAEKRPRKRN